MLCLSGALVGCAAGNGNSGAGEPAAAKQPGTAPPPSTSPASAPGTPEVSRAPSAGSTTAASPKSPVKVRVPKVVGHNHQTAQNELQAAGFFMLAEKDATGQGRMLLWDRNWVVVRQYPKAGAKVGTGTTITLYSKKIGE